MPQIPIAGAYLEIEGKERGGGWKGMREEAESTKEKRKLAECSI